MAVRKVYVDPGHGGADPGAIGNGIEEEDIALAVGLKVAEHLRRHGLEVRMSRTADVGKSLSQRTNEANAWGADAYVSIHCNASTSPAAEGFEVWHTIFTSSSKGDELARAIVKYMDLLTPLKNRGTKSKRGSSGRDYLHVIRETRMPAVLIEMGFVSNAKDAAYLKSASGQAATAEAIARGVVEWAGLVWKELKVAAASKPVAPKQAGQPVKRYRLKTGVFPDAESLAAAKKLVRDRFGWVVYEWAEGEYRDGGIWSPDYRLLTGTFDGLEAAEDAARRLREATGWVVYVIAA